MRRKLLTVPAAVPAPTFAGAGTGAACSGPRHWMYTDDDSPGGKVEFWSNYDIWKVCDIQAGGARVHVVLGDIEPTRASASPRPATATAPRAAPATALRTTRRNGAPTRAASR